MAKNPQETAILNEMYRFSEMMILVTEQSHMEHLSQNMAQALEQNDPSSLNPFVIHCISHNLCSKYFVLLHDNFVFPPSAYILLEVLFTRKLVPPVYQSILSDLLSKKNQNIQNQIRINKESKFQSMAIDQNSLPYVFGDENELNFNMGVVKEPQTQKSLLGLLNFDYQTERYINKRFGYSLLDLQGRFIWSDENSQKLFEIKPEEMQRQSLFDLMIPHSKAYLRKKFGQELFQEKKEFGTSMFMSFVIYSKNSMNKFVKQARKAKRSSKNKDTSSNLSSSVQGKEYEQERERSREKEYKKSKEEKQFVKQQCTNLKGEADVFAKELDFNNSDEIYYKFLKALSSKVTLIALTFTVTEFQEIISNKDYQIDFDQTKDQILTPKMLQEPDKQVTKYAVLLETRLSRNVPKFDFSKLVDDPKITSLKDIMLNKLKPKQSQSDLKSGEGKESATFKDADHEYVVQEKIEHTNIQEADNINNQTQVMD